MTQPAPHAPIDCADLELSAPPEPGPRAPGHLLVRLHGHPLGVLQVDAHARASDGGRSAALEAFAGPVAEHLTADGLVSGDPAPVPHCGWDAPEGSGLVTVVVCTLGEDPRLVRTVESVLGQTYPELEVVVVDNRPTTGRVPELLDGIADPRVRIVPESARGLSAARNAGVAHARGELIAFTDDDAHADPDWVRRLSAGFACGDQVVAVTGLVVPDELRTPAQHLFEEFGGFDKGFSRTVWSMRPASLGVRAVTGSHGGLFPYSAGVYGSGNNMAFRASWLRASGLFDEALGAGSLTKGGEDLDAFLAVMLDGKVLVYEPAAVVRHSAREGMAELASQLYGYGSGNSAAMIKHAMAGPRRTLAVLARVPTGLRRLLDPRSEKNSQRSAGYPPDLARRELRGFAAGPVLYLRSRREARRRRAAHPLAVPPAL
ncbi:glycosyltransferase [Isoptericola sp. b441]|uniref:Glycosyltransferase n=1 Tax=Actinotalea lenta TaxID=3064654 RepID=A0ABT9D5E5_9CELL|nr:MULTISPECIES: glycosyltransferase [unclassified Isoptericola]MDO8106004.1 glycosyltransferase [Isoptericola sp. b441]MDO8122277.1 glycosyltransferase [Isoptericola sp. b490]